MDRINKIFLLFWATAYGPHTIITNLTTITIITIIIASTISPRSCHPGINFQVLTDPNHAVRLTPPNSSSFILAKFKSNFPIVVFKYVKIWLIYDRNKKYLNIVFIDANFSLKPDTSTNEIKCRLCIEKYQLKIRTNYEQI